MREVKIIASVYFLSFFIVSLKCQVNKHVHEQFRFNHITVDEGLTSNRVRGLMQDKYGFIWIGTSSDISCFDGYTVKTYPVYLSDSVFKNFTETRCLFSDSEGNLWSTGYYGICCFDWVEDSFIRFNPGDIEKDINTCFGVDEDENGNLWFTTNAGLLKYNLSSGKSTLYQQKRSNSKAPGRGRLSTVFVARNGDVWYGYTHYGLGVYNPKDSLFTHFLSTDDKNSLAGNRVERIYQDDEGYIWIGHSNSGISRYDYNTHKFTRYVPEPDRKESCRVRGLIEDKNGNFWIGTRGGLYLFDKDKETFRRYAHTGHPVSVLGHNSIQVMFIDNQEMIWMGTFAGGVSYTSLVAPGFIRYDYSNIPSDYFLNDKTVLSLEYDNHGDIWIGTENGGLNYLNRKTGKITHFVFDPENKNTPRSNNIKSIHADNDGIIWFGTYKGGMSSYNPYTKRFSHFVKSREFKRGIEDESIFCITTDNIDDNLLWVGTTNQLYTFDKSKEEFSLISPENPDYKNIPEIRQVKVVCHAPDNQIVFGTNGIVFLDRKTNTFEKVSSIYGEAIDLVSFLIVDKYNYLWASINNKFIVRMDTETKAYVKIDSTKGLPSGIKILGAAADTFGNLWLSSSNGIFKLDGILDNQDTCLYIQYDKSDNLQSLEFNIHSYTKSGSGEILFGGIKGFNSFYPQNINSNSYKPKIVLTKLEIFGEEVEVGEKFYGQAVLSKPMLETKSIYLHHRNKVFTIHFSGLHYVSSSNNLFKYKLEGYDKKWRVVNSDLRSVTYSNIPGGEYVFKINAANNDGVWSDEPRELAIFMDTPVWKTLWFLITSCLTFIAMVFLVYQIRIRSVRKRNVVLENTVRHRTVQVTVKNQMLQDANDLLKDRQEEILVQNEELAKHRNNLELLVGQRTAELKEALKKAKESDALKSAFLANISHEIRTPMNAIVGLTAMLNDSAISEDEKTEFVQLIQSNSRTLLKIIDEILELSLLESDQLRIVEKGFDLNVVLNQHYHLYYKDNKNPMVKIQKSNSVQDLNIQIYSDEFRFAQILTNLLDNARKFTTRGHIELGAYIGDEYLCVYVNDTGKGIPEEKLSNIFEHFNKVQDAKSMWVQGMGLGLAISQKIAKALGGIILAESNLGKGSTFTFCLPEEKFSINDKKHKKVNHDPVVHDLNGKTIMIADKAKANFYCLQKILGNTSSSIVWAKNGKEAVEKATEQGLFDLILMDIKMPVMDGCVAARKIKELHPEQIIVAQISNSRPNEKHRFNNNSFDDYISKPINKSELIKALNKYL